MLNSGLFISQMRLAHERELEVRAILTWESLVRAHKNLGGSLELISREDLKGEIRNKVQGFAVALTTSISHSTQNVRQGLVSQTDISLESARQRALQKHEVEIDLYMDSLEVPENNRQGHQYIFYGSVGAVQTGANATANVTQNLGASDRDAIIQALELARDAIGQTEALSVQQRQELTAIARECETEMRSAEPNNTKLRGMFNVLATSIQTMASTRGAYDALKSALLPLGITLP
jgi:hypothetical protein